MRCKARDLFYYLEVWRRMNVWYIRLSFIGVVVAALLFTFQRMLKGQTTALREHYVGFSTQSRLDLTPQADRS
jgi:hypothetical protein